MIELVLVACLSLMTGWILGHFGVRSLGRALLDGKEVATE
jgi:hypothetical protein